MINISVLMPTYNRAEFIAEALNSVIPQLSRNDEIIIIDDGSTDNTKEIVKPFLKNKKIRYIIKQHTNAPHTRNLLIKVAQKEWILWIDSDDILLPNTVALFQKQILKYPEVDVFYGDLVLFGNITNTNKMKFNNYYNKNSELIFDMFGQNRIPNPGTFVKKSLYEIFGMYNENFLRLHDYEFWNRTLKNTKFKHVGKYVCKWRWHNKNMSSGSVIRDKKYDGMVLDEFLQRYSIKEIFYFYNWMNENEGLYKAFLLTGKNYSARHDFLKANECLLKALSYKKTNKALYSMFVNLMKSGDTFNLILTKLSKKLLKTIINYLIGSRKNIDMFYLASFYKKIKKNKLAEDLFNKLINKKSVYLKNKSLAGKSFFHLGEINISKRNNKTAYNYFSKALKYCPDHYKAKIYLEKIST